MNPIAETNRLILREFEISDAERFYRLNSNTEVIQYTGDEPFKDIKAAEEFLKNYDHYLKYGFGRWAVILKDSDEFIGWCGLKYTPEWDEHDIGFRFFQQHWGKGYATESALKCLELAKEKFEITRIVGRAVKQNAASIQVLKKLGFIFKKEMDFHGMEGIVFEYIF